jgi:hypothetical protein
LCAYLPEINSQQLTNRTQRQNAVACVTRGVFKKRPNFLNSAPTCTESAMRLLSAPECVSGSIPTMEETLGTVYYQ